MSRIYFVKEWIKRKRLTKDKIEAALQYSVVFELDKLIDLNDEEFKKYYKEIKHGR